MAIATMSHEGSGSNKQTTPESQSPESADADGRTKKRGSISAGLDKEGNPKPVKRRAAKACRACRSRKVRCDVMQRYHVSAEGEATCTNCNIDGIQCVIDESKRRKWVMTLSSTIDFQPLHLLFEMSPDSHNYQSRWCGRIENQVSNLPNLFRTLVSVAENNGRTAYPTWARIEGVDANFHPENCWRKTVLHLVSPPFHTKPGRMDP